MPSEATAAVKPHKAKSAAAGQKYLKIPYTYVRLLVSIFVAFAIVLGVSFYRISQYQVSERANIAEYTKLTREYNDLEAQANELKGRLNLEENKSDSTQTALSQQASKINEQDSKFNEDLDEFQKKTQELQDKLDELEKAKEDIVNQLNSIKFLPGVASLPLTQPATLAVSYSSSPTQLLGYKLDSLSDNADEELSAYHDLAETFDQIKPILEDYPCMWPIKGKVTSAFGTRQNPMGGSSWEYHTGLDIAVPMNSDIKATGGGVVKFAGWDGGYGNLVIINHGMGLETYYGHNTKVLVKAGDTVTRGQVIAKSGSTGNSTGPHCHYEVRVNGVPVSPVKYVTLSGD